MSRLRTGSTNVIEIKGLRDTVTNTYPTTASAVLTLEQGGVPVAGAVAVPMPHVAGTAGHGTLYRATLPHTIPLTPGTYTIRATATDAAGNVREFVQSVACVAG